MRRLLLLRHAKTETDAPSGHDQDRRLDGRGHRDAAEIGGWMAVSTDERHRILERVAERRESLGADKIEAERQAKRAQRIAERAARRAARA